MPSAELTEEIDAIQAIYPESVQELTPDIYNITIPEHEDVIMQMSFPHSYPDEIPNIIQVVTKNDIKYPDSTYMEGKFKDMLSGVFHKGEVVIFEMIGEVTPFLEKLEEEHREQIEQAEAKAKEELNKRKVASLQSQARYSPPSVVENKVLQDIDVLKGWIQSDPISDRGSTFVAFARKVDSVEQAEEALELLVTDRKVGRANHNMNAWRIKGANGVSYQDCDDDGETAAGLRMLHLMTVCTTTLANLFVIFALGYFFSNSFGDILTSDHGRLERHCGGQ